MSGDPSPFQPYPRFSDAEVQRRREALAASLAEADVEHVVLYGANRSGSAVQWLTRWPVTREAAVVHTPGDTDLLLVHFFNHVPNARRMATEAQVRWAGDTTSSVVAELERRGAGERTRVGVVGPAPHALHVALAERFGAAIDLSAAYTRLRLVKSAEEVDWLRRAALLTDRSCEALRDGARPGLNEHELGALVEAAYLGAGGANYIHYFSVTSMSEPTQCVPSQWPTARSLEVGDVLSCELSTAYGVDYPGQLLRTFTVAAEPTALYRELHAVAEAALERIEQVLRPGATPAEVVAAAGVIEDAGFSTVDDLVHGLGGGYLPPVLGSASRTLEPLPPMTFTRGMTVVVQPNVVVRDGSAGVQTGELLHITDDGCERLHAFPRGLSRIA
ncbi:MAG TPA: M24 family metallopeptidase [Angustibacter sp.]|nr:M24 family metallopeptidase [Angustibacter sp.]